MHDPNADRPRPLAERFFSSVQNRKKNGEKKNPIKPDTEGRIEGKGDQHKKSQSDP